MLQAPAGWGPGGWSAPCGSHDAHVTVIGPDVRSAEAGGAWRAVTSRDPAASLSILAGLRAACPALPAAPSPVPERRGRTRTCCLHLFMLRDVYRSIADNFGVSEARGVVFDSASALACRPLNPQKPAQAPRTRRPRHATPRPPHGLGQVAPAQVGRAGQVQQHVVLGRGAAAHQVPAGQHGARVQSCGEAGGRGEEAWSGARGLGVPSPAAGRGRGPRRRARRPPPHARPARGRPQGAGGLRGRPAGLRAGRALGKACRSRGSGHRGPSRTLCCRLWALQWRHTLK